MNIILYDLYLCCVSITDTLWNVTTLCCCSTRLLTLLLKRDVSNLYIIRISQYTWLFKNSRYRYLTINIALMYWQSEVILGILFGTAERLYVNSDTISSLQNAMTVVACIQVHRRHVHHLHFIELITILR